MSRSAGCGLACRLRYCTRPGSALTVGGCRSIAQKRLKARAPGPPFQMSTPQLRQPSCDGPKGGAARSAHRPDPCSPRASMQRMASSGCRRRRCFSKLVVEPPILCLKVAPHLRILPVVSQGTRMQHSTVRCPSAELYGSIKFHMSACAAPLRLGGGLRYLRLLSSTGEGKATVGAERLDTGSLPATGCGGGRKSALLGTTGSLPASVSPPPCAVLLPPGSGTQQV
mmetsp:Transcript_13062/g.23262  ORF Transcript_13062/g.23262 Transcript_13062/m.23262 type:complete len:226 (+) Transcript_13062:253-930(+)